MAFPRNRAIHQSCGPARNGRRGLSPDFIQLLPEGFPPLTALFLIVASVFTSALTAAFGVGGGVSMLVLMGLFMPVTALIPVHGAVQFGSNAGRAWNMRSGIVWSATIPFAMGAAAGAALGGAFVVELPETLLKSILAVFVIALTWMKLPALPLRASTPVFAAGGLTTTAMTMFIGATGPLVATLMGRAFPDRRQVVANTAVGMTAQHFLKVAVFGVLGFTIAPWLPLIATMVASGYLGTTIGGRWLDRMDEAVFRKWFRIGITVLALELMRSAFF